MRTQVPGATLFRCAKGALPQAGMLCPFGADWSRRFDTTELDDVNPRRIVRRIQLRACEITPAIRLEMSFVCDALPGCGYRNSRRVPQTGSRRSPRSQIATRILMGHRFA